MRLSMLTILAVSLTAHLPGAEMQLDDLRLGGGLLSHEFSGASSTTVTTGGGAVTTSNSSDSGRNADQNYRGQLEFVGGHLGNGGGLIWGLGIAVNHAVWHDASQDASVSTPCVDVMLGYGYAFTPSWHLEIAPFVGAGRAYYSVTDSGQTTTSKNWQKYVEYGARIGTYYTFSNTFQLGLEVPYMVGSFEPSYSYQSGPNQVNVSDKRSNKGLGILASIGVRF